MLNEQDKKIEEYLNGEMSNDERQAFEAAIKNDAELAKEVTFQKDLMQFFEERNPDLERKLSELGDEFFEDDADISSNKKKYFNWLFLVVGLVLLSALGGYIYINNLNARQFDASSDLYIDAEKAINEGMEHDNGNEDAPDTMFEEEEEEKQQTQQQETEQEIEQETTEENTKMDSGDITEKSPPPMAEIDIENYKVNPMLEGIIRENVRSDGNNFKITFPRKEQTFYSKNDIINFRLEGNSSIERNVQVVLYDNKESSFSNDQYVLSTTKDLKNGDFSFSINIELKNGLYYYVMQEKETGKILHVSKFDIKKR
ncbi:MAG: hypothetical protein AB8G11_06415 [Saprospiraceae bacterium]